MVRHIVFFRFKEGLSEDDRACLIDALEGLKAKIALIKELEVGKDLAGKHNSYDLALNSVFDCLDDVEAYAVHPDHVEVVKLVKEVCESSVKVDFEF